MIDLSNNNGSADFKRLFLAGHRRAYLKLNEDPGFVDRTFKPFRTAAHKNGIGTGAYCFAHPGAVTPSESAAFFLKLLPALDRTHPKVSKGATTLDLRPCLDFEYGTPHSSYAAWATEWMQLVRKETGVLGIIYGNGPYLEACGFSRAFCGLWLASYGRDDGHEYPFKIPRPWKSIVAHQFSSKSRVAGVSGYVDVSHVFSTAGIDLPKARA